MFSWTKFILEGTTECTKDLKMKFELTTSWSDNRFAKDEDWL